MSERGGPWGSGRGGGRGGGGGDGGGGGPQGPWGSGRGGGDGGRGGDGGGGPPPPRPGPRPPDFEEMLRRSHDPFRHLFPGGGRAGDGLGVGTPAVGPPWPCARVFPPPRRPP